MTLAKLEPGTPVPVYLAGSKITGSLAFGPTIGASLNTTLLSYAGTCDIGINIDAAAVARGPERARPRGPGSGD